MIELKNDGLEFSFPEIKEELRVLVKKYAESVLPSILSENRKKVLASFYRNRADFQSLIDDRRGKLKKLLKELRAEDIEKVILERGMDTLPHMFSCDVQLQRTLRLPDDEKTYPLPPGLDAFPLRHVDDFENTVPAHWLLRGGVIMPMYQAEAMWLNFVDRYPCAVKVGAGKVNAISGEEWKSGLGSETQDYMVVPGQPWLDGFSVAKGEIRQFVAMPLGKGYSVEEQITGEARWGGLQLQVYPMKADYYFKTHVKNKIPYSLEPLLPMLLPDLKQLICYGSDMIDFSGERAFSESNVDEMVLAEGGRMQQEIYEDPHGVDCWDQETTSRCFVHLCNALDWRAITGANPPQAPVTAKEYESAGLPWFDYYRDDLAVLEGSKTLAELKSIAGKDKEVFGSTGFDVPLGKVPEVVTCSEKKRPGVVREW
ncbi:MAG: hypothetical protein CMO55_25775 [Verrucomicrobiales bacterium]|nr:hypothetical protein [Verrucomicrobiales bacterium]